MEGLEEIAGFVHAFGGDVRKRITEHYFSSADSDKGATPEPENLAAHVINPVSKGRVEHVDENLGFVIMPFDGEAFEALYEDVIRNVMEAEGYRCLRADESHGRVIGGPLDEDQSGRLRGGLYDVFSGYQRVDLLNIPSSRHFVA